MNRVRELRRARKMTQDELGALLGVQKAAVCKYETGRVALPPEMLLKLCDIFDVSADHMLCRDANPIPKPRGDLSALFMPVREAVGVPLVGRVHAGLPMLAEENITEYIPVPAVDVRMGDYFYMEVEGDCMIGEFIPEGALVLVKVQPRVENGQIAVVRTGDEVLVRKLKWMPPHLMLIPANVRYEPLIVSEGDVQIIGRVVEVRIRGL
ncbi:MAG: S24 family peptidase [Eubacteriales bacterium]|nr:S24 family peptidase [Eubacteriales bacterium]